MKQIKREVQKRGRKTLVVVIVAIIAVLLVLGALFAYDQIIKKPVPEKQTSSTSSQPSTPRPEFVYKEATAQDFKNLEDILSQNIMMSKLPDDSKIVLTFYSFNSGERVWENSYILSNNGVTKGTLDDYDIKLIMHSKYITALNENNFCDIIQDAQRHGDFGSEAQGSKLSLAWKYKSILDYRSCFGM